MAAPEASEGEAERGEKRMPLETFQGVGRTSGMETATGEGAKKEPLHRRNQRPVKPDEQEGEPAERFGHDGGFSAIRQSLRKRRESSA